MKLKLHIVIPVVVAAAVLLLIMRNKTVSSISASGANQQEVQVPVASTVQADLVASADAIETDESSDLDTTKTENQSSEQVRNAQPSLSSGKEAPALEAIMLTSGNFESFVLKCFQGEPCELVDDPMKMYNDFKISENRQAADNLISYLRSRLSDPKERERYKGVLKDMITDFYPPEERQFQEAAYYNYLGDLRKSLDLYLDLEKKAVSNPSLRPAPKLNIANTLYDLGRFKDALPYYQAALSEYTSGQQDVMVPSKNEMMRFIEERVEDIQGKISL